MMALALLGIIGLVMALYVRAERLRLGDVPLMVFLLSAAVFLSRFNVMFTVNILEDRPITGFLWYLMIAALVLGLLRGMMHRSLNRSVRRVFRLTGIFAALALISGFVHGGVTGASSALQVLMITLPPVWVAGLISDNLPRDRETSRRLRAIFLLLTGVLTPMFVIVSALKPELFGSLLGWRAFTNEMGAGFVRGWSPLGNTISSGVLIVMAYALALHEALVARRRRFLIIAGICGLAILFTLARSVIVVFIVFHLAYWALYGLKSRNWEIVAAPLILVALLTGWALKSDYSFDRFARLNDFSSQVRQTSARVALRESVRKPLLGQGPGLFYEEPRRNLSGAALGGDHRQLQMTGEEMTATEPHNLYLWLLVEHGWIAAGVFLAMIGLLIKGVARCPARSETDRSLRSMYLSVWIALLVFLLSHSDLMHNPKFSLFFWLWAFSGVHWCASLRAERAGELNEE